MKTMLKTFKWWWSWDFRVIEDYLEEMAMNGWQLKNVGFGMVIFYFNKSKPKKIRYCVEYNPSFKPDYHLLLADDGWKLMGQKSGWLLWEKPYNNKRPEIFTEPDSLINRNNKLLKLLYPLLVINVLNLFMQSSRLIINRSSSFINSISFVLIVLLLSISVLLLMGVMKIKNHNSKLQCKKR